MDKFFEILFIDETFEFLKGLERKHYEKILYNIRKAQIGNDPELFKKLNNENWEFRTLYQVIQYRLLAFWDKTSTTETLVISTHGFIKNEARYLKMKYKKLSEFGQNILKKKKLITRKNENIYFRPSTRPTYWEERNFREGLI